MPFDSPMLVFSTGFSQCVILLEDGEVGVEISSKGVFLVYFMSTLTSWDPSPLFLNVEWCLKSSIVLQAIKS